MGVVLGRKIADGRTSEVFEFGAGSVAKVLRPQIPPAWAEIEASFTMSVAALGLPVPRVGGVQEIDGRPAIIVERVAGVTLWEQMIATPNDLDALCRDHVELQRSIHRAGVPDGLPSLSERLKHKIDRAALAEDERIRAHLVVDSTPVGAAVLHGDFHPGNVIVGRNGLCVIDWFDAAVGHPDADVARTTLLLEPVGATSLYHLPGGSPKLLTALSEAYRRMVGGRSSASQADWFSLMAVSRVAEDADASIDQLLAIWHNA